VLNPSEILRRQHNVMSELEDYINVNRFLLNNDKYNTTFYNSKEMLYACVQYT